MQVIEAMRMSQVLNLLSSMEHGNGMPCFDERILGEVKGLVPVPAHPKAQVINRLLIGIHQLLKGVLVPLTCPANQFLFVQILTSNPV